MPEPVPCYLLTETGQVRLYLRRYRKGALRTCSGPAGYCTAMVLFEAQRPARYSIPEGDTRRVLAGFEDLAPPHTDPRWPTRCKACGHPFDPNDHWQVFQVILYARADTGEVLTLDDAPPGAIWEADYLRPGPDGKSYMAKLPGGSQWWIDGASQDGGHWTRTGVAPALTVNPSIHDTSNGYHGFLRNGVFEPCGDSKH